MTSDKDFVESRDSGKEQLVAKPGQLPSETIKGIPSMEDSEMKTFDDNDHLTKSDSSPEDNSLAEEKELLRFTCPKCGGHVLVEGQWPFSCYCNVEGGDPEYGDLEYEKDSDGHIDLEYKGDGGEFWYECGECDYELEGIDKPSEMCEWLKANCQPEAS